ncbi:MAG: dihydrodipicolinate synthase family protein, partial [Acidobacteriota bacterium]
MGHRENIFAGCMPALMTPCGADGAVNFEALVHTGRDLIDAGMNAVVYCGSMGDWPLGDARPRQDRVERL